MWVSQQPPRIDAVDPDTFASGSTVAVEGRGFGDFGRLAVDQMAIPRENVRRWTPNLIIFDVPDQSRSGLLRVTTSDGTSNPVFVTAEADLPTSSQYREVDVSALSPDSTGVGTRLVLEGYGFGPRSAIAELAFIGDDSEFRVAGDHDGVLQWSNRRIEVVIPHEVPAGDFQISINGHGTDSSVAIVPRGGERTFGELRQFAVRTAMTLRAPSSEIFAVLPRGLTFDEQPQAQLIRENLSSQRMGPGPDATYHISPTDSVQRVDRVVLVGRRAVQWSIDTGRSSDVLLEQWFRRAYRRYLAVTDDIPRDHTVVTDLRRALQLRDPVVEIARAVHQSVMSTLEPDPSGTQDAVRAVESGEEAGSYAYATLAAAVARSAGVPARRHFGVLLDDGGRSIPHAWVEFLVPGVGWIPADPALGDGMLGEELSSLNDFYGDDMPQRTFGSLDDRRVTLSVDGEHVPRLYPAGSMREPDPNWAPGILRLEIPADSFPDDVEYQWDPPTLFGWFD
ncbi:MAG: transglutaminase domain-containing protein [Alkalispirochaeta sp.]